jgi:DNA-binding NtrC family response regulator
MKKKNKISPTVEPAPSPLQCQTNPPQRILVVDADGDVRQVSTELLLRCGYEVDAAENAAAAWRALNTVRYDLVITDHAMLDVPGAQLPKKLRAAHLALPINTGTGTPISQESTPPPWLQPAATLLMPYTVAEFLGTVKEVLRATESACKPTAPPPSWPDGR